MSKVRDALFAEEETSFLLLSCWWKHFISLYWGKVQPFIISFCSYCLRIRKIKILLFLHECECLGHLLQKLIKCWIVNEQVREKSERSVPMHHQRGPDSSSDFSYSDADSSFASKSARSRGTPSRLTPGGKWLCHPF